MFRDPRYLAPLAVLLGVIFVSAVLAEQGSKGSAAASVPTVSIVAATAAPEPTPTPDGAAIDARRLRDLVKIRDAFLAYRRQNGKFPVTKDGITTICATSFDPGCVLASGAGAVRFTDGVLPYWFVSDGARVVLVAPAESPADTAQCPAALPLALAGKFVMCLKFDRPAQ